MRYLYLPLCFIAGVVLAYTAWGAQKQRATQFPGYLVVTTCGTLPSGITYTAGNYEAGTVDTTGKRC